MQMNCKDVFILNTYISHKGKQFLLQ